MLQWCTKFERFPEKLCLKWMETRIFSRWWQILSRWATDPRPRMLRSVRPRSSLFSSSASSESIGISTPTCINDPVALVRKGGIWYCPISNMIVTFACSHCLPLMIQNTSKYAHRCTKPRTVDDSLSRAIHDMPISIDLEKTCLQIHWFGENISLF